VGVRTIGDIPPRICVAMLPTSHLRSMTGTKSPSVAAGNPRSKSTPGPRQRPPNAQPISSLRAAAMSHICFPTLRRKVASARDDCRLCATLIRSGLSLRRAAATLTSRAEGTAISSNASLSAPKGHFFNPSSRKRPSGPADVTK
jgi:hypothetical protein